ncbi:ThuA domain-containing protein [Haloferula rosea]|uniref:ThuA domain-containing protein n=1 Tax=Haloferula rosea TaxID=490093 RepID=A0A934R713_9BACT|nr:ThuA domain-containing protein [Haloferula rosea]MBK1825397.1 ThuA domain-containing protein [Haloferula rosea]
MNPKLLISSLLIATSGLPAVAETKEIVFIAGRKSHASGEHEFRAGSLLLAKALNEQSGLDVKASVVGVEWAKTPKVLENADAIVIYCDASKAIAGKWDELDRLAKNGAGLMFMHYAVHPSKENADKYQRRWVGAAMETGFSVNPHWLAELKVMPGHEISRGVPEAFESYDEFYYNMRFQDDREAVLDLVTAVPTRERMRRYINLWNWYGAEGMNKPQTLMWGVEREDGGRGVGFTGGHYHKNWALDGFRTVVLNAIVWTAGMEVPEGGVKSQKVTEDELNANLDSYGDKKNPRITLPDLEEIRKMAPAKIKPEREAAPCGCGGFH